MPDEGSDPEARRAGLPHEHIPAPGNGEDDASDFDDRVDLGELETGHRGHRHHERVAPGRAGRHVRRPRPGCLGQGHLLHSLVRVYTNPV